MTTAPPPAVHTVLTHLRSCAGTPIWLKHAHFSAVRRARHQDRHLLVVEKPISYTLPRASHCANEFERQGITLQVGYMKRQYEGVRRVARLIEKNDIVSVRVDLVHPPEDAYLVPVLGRGRPHTGDLIEFLDSATAQEDVAARLAVLGVQPNDVVTQRAYFLLATSVIHDVNLIRGLLGDPRKVPLAYFWNGGLAGQIVLAYSPNLTAFLGFSYIQGGAYEESVRLVGKRGRWTLRLPSPYPPHLPATLESVSGSAAEPPVFRSDQVSLLDPFDAQLQEFYRAVAEGGSPQVGGAEAAGDLALVERIIGVALAGVQDFDE